MEKYKRGNFTIECALIMPLIMLSIILLLCLMIHMYDRIVINKALIHGVMACDYCREDQNYQIKKMIENRINEELSGSLVAIDRLQIGVKANDIWCEADIEASHNFPEIIPDMNTIFTIRMKKKKSILSGGEYIRNVNKLEKYSELIQKINGYNNQNTREEYIEGGIQEGIE